MKLATRQEILALGWMADGSPIWPIVGADPEPVDDPSGGDPAGGGGDPTGGDPEAVVPPDPGSTPDTAALLQQIETLTRRMQAADKSKGEYERKLREYEDQGKNELQKAQ